MHRTTLVRDLALVTLAKLLLIWCGSWLFFGPETRLIVTPQSVIEHFAPPAADAVPPSPAPALDD